MDNSSLNVVYIGAPSFPIGGATTKRRRYMVDYMNNHGIQSHYLVCDFKQRGKRQNATSGKYGLCDYYDITPLAERKQFCCFYKEGKKHLNGWYTKGKRNILIFGTILSIFEFPLYSFARKLGYTIVFDQVETSYLQNGKSSLLHRLNLMLSEYVSDKAYRHSAAFVISKNLLHEVQEKYPERQICLLQNSTPQLSVESRKNLNKPLKVLYSGTYAHKDGVEYLLKGVIEAHDSGADIELTLLGKGAKRDMSVLDMTKNKEYVHYLGFVSDEDLVRLLIEHDVLCMTRCNSRFANYGFPFKLSEYLSTGNIVLATAVGDVCDYINDKVSAYIVPPEDSHAISETLHFIISNPKEALSVARGGLAAMQQYFSIEKVGEKFIAFLSRI